MSENVEQLQMFALDSLESESRKRQPKSLDSMIDDLAGVFTDPLVVSPGGWHDTLPGWIKEQVTIERLIMNLQVSKGEDPTGTDAEACAYLYTRSLEAPMDHDWTEIYLYLATKLMERKGTEIPDDIRTDSINDYQMSQLRDLKRWIYHRRTGAREQRCRAERRQAKDEVEAKAPKQLTLDED